MSHDPRFDELALAYLTGGISPAEMMDFELRLKTDVSARARLAELSEQEMALRQVFVHEENQRQLVPETVSSPAGSRRASKSGLPGLRRTRVTRGRRAQPTRSLWLPLTAAAGLLLCLLLFLVHRSMTDSGRVANAPQDSVRQPDVAVQPKQNRSVGNVVYVAADGVASREMRLCRHDGRREERLPLVQGMALLAGDRIETGPREPAVEELRPVRAAVALAGRTIDLADETRVEAVSEAEVRMDGGMLYAVASGELPASVFTVRTPHVDVRSERATLDLSVTSEETALLVENGTASVRNAQGVEQVQSLQKSVARSGHAPTPAIAIYASALWRGREGPVVSAPVGGEPAVLSFTLIDADRDEPIAGFDPLPAGGTVILNLAKLPTRNLNIRANTRPGDGISVRFDFDSKVRYKLEQFAPYAFNGDRNADYDPWIPALGTHVITATPFADLQGRGKPGQALRVTLQVIDR